MNDTFTLYARTTPGHFNMVHTSVKTQRYEFNCFGDAIVPGDGSQGIGTAIGSEKWAAAAYGEDRGKINSGLQSGLSIWYSGRCQSAANRILSLTREGIDARGAFGNAAVVLIYGKYGFDVPSFTETVKRTGAQLLQSDPGEITQADIDTAVGRLIQGQTANGELEILHADVQKQFGIVLPDITDDRRNKFCTIYSEYQASREAAFRQIGAGNPRNIEQALLGALKAPWLTCCDRLDATLTSDGFRAVLGKTPEEAKQVFNYA